MLENNYFNLFLGVPDTDLAKLIESCQKKGEIYNKIYEKIETELDQKGLQKKKVRIHDQKYIDMQTCSLNGEFDNIGYKPQIGMSKDMIKYCRLFKNRKNSKGTFIFNIRCDQFMARLSDKF